MAAAELDDGVIWVTCGYADNDRMTQVPGATHDRQSGRWKVPLSWAGCKVLRGVFGKDLEVGPELRAWSWEEWKGRIEPAMMLREAVELDADHPVAKLIDEIERR